MSSDSSSSTGFDLTTINKSNYLNYFFKIHNNIIKILGEKTNFWRSNDKFGKGALHDAKLARLIPAKLGLNEFCICQWSFVNIDVPDGSEKTTCGRVFDSSETLFAHIFDVHRIKFSWLLIIPFIIFLLSLLIDFRVGKETNLPMELLQLSVGKFIRTRFAYMFGTPFK